jgi:hypothetical protein
MMKIPSLVAAGTIFLLCGTALCGTTSIPFRKAGLWQQTVARDGVQLPISSQICVDQASEEERLQTVYGTCLSIKIGHNPDGSRDYACVHHNGVGPIERVTGDDKRKVMDSQESVVMTATWLGPCKAGQRGGDVILANGAKENVLDMTKSTCRSTGHITC